MNMNILLSNVFDNNIATTLNHMQDQSLFWAWGLTQTYNESIRPWQNLVWQDILNVLCLPQVY